MNADNKAREEAEAWAAGVTVTYDCADPHTGGCPVAGCTGHPAANTGPVAVPALRDTTARDGRQDGGALRAGDGPGAVPGKLATEGRVIAFDVLGSPAPKGSMRAITIGGHARLVPGGSNANRDAMRSWEQSVRHAIAVDLFDGSMPSVVLFEDKPLLVAIEFRMARPKSARKRAHPTTKPDIDKLARATLDAMIGSVLDDDSRIVGLTLVKTYAQPGREGAHITVREAT